MLDDVMVVMQFQCLSVNWLVEGPRIGSMLLGQHLPEDAVTVPQVLRQLPLFTRMLWDLTIFQVLLGRFDGAAPTLPSGHHLGLLGL